MYIHRTSKNDANFFGLTAIFSMQGRLEHAPYSSGRNIAFNCLYLTSIFHIKIYN
jgi:hypothetical protein